ncbi:putative diguanylate cyclase [Thiorhodovibrio winogradskyi]|uniref:Diguanylate cyclase n=1 Tax=Thiorhodovibrio winogradskyi TaxID=77007 RepID=A0ABZ0S7A1_9GAMM|nr:hypothetical protein [Thiorhodovibrio winogradskyi]
MTEPLVRDISRRLLTELGMEPPRPPLKAPLAVNPQQPLLARISDSAFALLTMGETGETLALGQRLLTGLNHPLELAGIDLPIKAKAGLADARGTDLDADTLLRHALAAAASARHESGGVQPYRSDPLERDTFLHLLDTNSSPRWRALPCPPLTDY